PDGRLVLSGPEVNGSIEGDHRMRLWDVETGQEVCTFTGHSNRVEGCTFSPDGRLVLSTAQDYTLRLWDVQSGQELTKWLTDSSLFCCAFSPDGQQIMA